MSVLVLILRRAVVYFSSEDPTYDPVVDLVVIVIVDVLFLAVMWKAISLMYVGVHKRVGIPLEGSIKTIEGVLEGNNFRFTVKRGPTDRRLEHRLEMHSSVRWHITASGEEISAGSWRGRTEVIIGPYEGDHVKVIDRLAREIDVTLDGH